MQLPISSPKLLLLQEQSIVQQRKRIEHVKSILAQSVFGPKTRIRGHTRFARISASFISSLSLILSSFFMSGDSEKATSEA